MYELFLDGVRVYLDPKTKIALSLSFWNPLFPNQVQVGYTNEFSLPDISANRKFFELLNKLNSLSNKAKTRMAARVKCEGIEIIPHGIAELVSFEGQFKCRLLVDYFRLYTTLAARLLPELDYRDINVDTFGWSAIGVENNLERAEILGGDGEVFPLVVDPGDTLWDIAGQKYFVSTIPLWSGAVGQGYVPLWFGYKQVLQRCIKQAGFNYDWGKLFDGVNDDPLFNTLAICQRGEGGKWPLKYSDAYGKRYIEYEAQNSQAQNYVNLGNTNYGIPVFDVLISDAEWWVGAGNFSNLFKVINPDTSAVFVGVEFNFSGSIFVASGIAKAQWLLNGAVIKSLDLVAGTNTVDFSVSYLPADNLAQLKHNDEYEFVIRQAAVNPFDVTIGAGSVLKATMQGGNPNNYIYYNELLPEINQLSLLKDFLYRFGQMPRFVNNIVSFKSFNDILKDYDNLNDWTGKRVTRANPKEEIEYHLPLFQKNILNHTVIDGAVSSNFLSGEFDIDDATLKLSGVYTGLFGVMQSKVKEGVYCGSMIAHSGASPEFNRSLGNRLAIVRENRTSEPSIVFGVLGPITTYPVGVSSQEKEPTSLSWQKVLDDRYPHFRWGRMKPVRRVYDLSSLDIYNFNPHKMVRDGDELFMPFVDIETFVKGQETSVRMYKI